MNDFAEKIKKKKEESDKNAKMMDEQLILFRKIQKVIPDVTGSWNHGCLSTRIILEKPIFWSDIVNKDYDELSFAALGCCHDGYDDPYFVRPIKIVEGQRVRANKKTCIARYGDFCEGYDPEPKWEENVLKNYGKEAVIVVQDFLDKHPYVYHSSWDDDEDDDD